MFILWKYILKANLVLDCFIEYRTDDLDVNLFEPTYFKYITRTQVLSVKIKREAEGVVVRNGLRLKVSSNRKVWRHVDGGRRLEGGNAILNLARVKIN